MNRKLLSTLLVVTLISMSFPAAFAGGEFSQIDTTALILAGATSTIAWYMYAFTALGIGAFWFARNPYNVRNIKAIMGDYLDRFSKTD